MTPIDDCDVVDDKSQPRDQGDASGSGVSRAGIPDRASFSIDDTVAFIWKGLGLPEDALVSLHLTGTDQVYPSSFKVDHLAQSTIALSALAAALVNSLRTERAVSKVTVPLKHACLEFKTERLYTIDGNPPESTWGPIGGLHQTADGYVRIHDSFSNHRYGALTLLGLSRDAEKPAVAEKARQWKRFELEDAAAKNGLAVYALRSYGEWDATPQAAAISNSPVQIRIIGAGGPTGLPPHMPAPGDRSLRGLRVLELTRVIAGPVAGKTLAAHGADVLWITSPTLPSLPDLDRNLARGKRTIQLDLTRAPDRQTLRRLARDADVFLQGYRPDSLGAKGFAPADLTAMNPGIVCADLSAFGPEGPWSGRRGFDSLVQTCSGMNVSEAERGDERGEAVVMPLPCQALDHAAGYLVAAGIAAAVYRRAMEGGSWQVDVSLAGVMKYLRSLGQFPGREGFEGASGLPGMDELGAEFFEVRESGFGKLKALRHAATVDGAMPGWDYMPKPLGSDEAKWL